MTLLTEFAIHSLIVKRQFGRNGRDKYVFCRMLCCASEYIAQQWRTKPREAILRILQCARRSIEPLFTDWYCRKFETAISTPNSLQNWWNTKLSIQFFLQMILPENFCPNIMICAWLCFGTASPVIAVFGQDRNRRSRSSNHSRSSSKKNFGQFAHLQTGTWGHSCSRRFNL